MKRIIFCILAIIILCNKGFAQEKEILNKIHNKDFNEALSMLQNTYKQDTNNASYYNILYNYYINPYNDNRDSLQAYYYLLQYNKVAKNKINTSTLAKELLTNIYKSKDIQQFNRYIELTTNLKDLNNEAKRIRNQEAYNLLLQNPTIEACNQFINSYPDAIQVEDVRSMLNKSTFDYYMDLANIDSLKYFVQTTTSDSYKEKANAEIDKLSFAKALKENSVEAYINYITQFPNGAYTRMAKTNIEKVQYDIYVLNSNITDMINYFDNHDSTDNNYKEVLSRLSLFAMQNLSIIATEKVWNINHDTLLLKQFAKKYVANLDLEYINLLIKTFPLLKDENFVTTALSKATTLNTLTKKENLTIEDYKTHKLLFNNLLPHTTSKLFERFYWLNNSLNKNKKVDFNLTNDVTFNQFLNAKNTEMDFILTNDNNTPLYTHSDILFTSKADTNGYGWIENSKNRDIFVQIKENDTWGKPFALPKEINSVYDECNAVLSIDKKILYFSSNNSMNFGKKDIYISVREDIDNWQSFSYPILLSEDLNTTDNDYVVGLTDSLLVITQDDNFNNANNLYLEGKTSLDIITGKIKNTNKSVKVNVYNKNTLKKENIIKTNDYGFFAMLKPKEEIIMNCTLNNYFSPLCDTTPSLYSIEDMVNKQTLLTIDAPFDDNGNITSRGKMNLELLSNAFKDTPYMLTIGVHAVTSNHKYDSKELSDQMASQIIDLLIQFGMQKENVIVTGYGKNNTMQGWENVNSIDIGAIKK
jgi:hypothetical protein